MEYINILFDWNWCSQAGVQEVFNIIRGVLNVLRIVVPILLIVMTTMDVIKKVINPEDKEGQKKIMNRALAALIVFLIPSFIKITFRVIDWGLGYSGSYNEAESGLSACWSGANYGK